MMMPVGRLVLLRSVAKEDMVQAMSWMLVPALIGPIVGPPLGGFIVTYLNWRWIFYLNLPIGVLGLALVTRYIVQVRERAPVRHGLGRLSAVGRIAGMPAVRLRDVEPRGRAAPGARPDRSSAWWRAALYIRHARRRPNPILDLSLMQVPTFRLSVIAGSLTRITQGAQPFLLPLMFQLGFGMSAAKSGSITLASAVGSLAMKWLAPRVLRRFGFRSSADRQRPDRHRRLRGLRPLPSGLAGGRHLRRAGGLRLLHVVPVHRLQHHRL